MNEQGKVCVSVAARTVSEMISKAERAAQIADVIEIRFDALDISEVEKCVAEISAGNFGKPLLATFRPFEQGGRREISFDERLNFWRKFADKFEFVDFETDIFTPTTARVIKSFHDFETVPPNLSEIFEKLSAQGSIIKIACHAEDAEDSLKVWRLLNKTRSENKNFVPIAMGDGGQWTRILGLAHGAKMTYAALDEAELTAPSQLTAQKMIDVFRIKQLTRQTAVYGLLAAQTGYSVSPEMHNEAFRFNNLDAVYVPFAVKNLRSFWRDFVADGNFGGLNLHGFSVTNPHKCEIIELLDEVDETARKIGAVNTVHIQNGRTFGYNTDAEGFIAPLLNSFGDLRDAKVAVIGAGGAARACLYALRKHGAKTTIFARLESKAQPLAEEFSAGFNEYNRENRNNFNDFDILVNATPIGTKGTSPVEIAARAEEFEKVQMVYDLVYNPFETSLLREAAKAELPRIGGLAMLVGQAVAQQKIWTQRDAPLREMSRAALNALEKINEK